jgi:tRNA threonylcarbamoyladenosine biosynthesis protein TsaE
MYYKYRYVTKFYLFKNLWRIFFKNLLNLLSMIDINFNLNSIADAAKQVASVIRPRLPFLLYGEMGSGKTTLTKHIVAALGGIEEVTSPTFTIMQSYQVSTGILWHVDLYRLEDAHQMDELGLDELNMHDILIIEWPERLGSRIFFKYLKGTLSVQNNNSRNLILENVG